MNTLRYYLQNEILVKHRLLAIAMLATLFSLGLQSFRIVYTGSLFYSNLVWNLFLAIIPLLISYLSLTAAFRKWYFFLVSGFLWLLFLPNAPYLVTDFVHLDDRKIIPLWFDLMLLMSFAWTGLIYWMISMRHFNEILVRAKVSALNWALNQLIIFVTAVGVYLGRDGRFNSWDVFVNPGEIFSYVFFMLRYPFKNLSFYGMTLALHVFLTLLWYFFASMQKK